MPRRIGLHYAPSTDQCDIRNYYEFHPYGKIVRKVFSTYYIKQFLHCYSSLGYDWKIECAPSVKRSSTFPKTTLLTRLVKVDGIVSNMKVPVFHRPLSSAQSLAASRCMSRRKSAMPPIFLLYWARVLSSTCAVL